jgi:nicotinic acid mononucleotide adenylyltransferase
MHYLGTMTNIEPENLELLERLELTLRESGVGSKGGYILISTNYEVTALGGRALPSTDILFFKGSFDPIHNGHIALFEATREKYPLSTGVFALSFQTLKRLLSHRDLAWRSLLIQRAGYPVVIAKSGYFADDAEFFRQNYPRSRVIFPVGIDTLVNLVDYYEVSEFEKLFSGCIFEYCNRDNSSAALPTAYQMLSNINSLGENRFPGLSSSLLKQLRRKGKIDILRESMPCGAADLFLSIVNEPD